MRKPMFGWLAVVTGMLTAVAGLTPVADASASTTTTTPPGPVHDAAAFDTGHAVRLTWTNPITPFAGVAVRYAQGRRAPQSPTDGTAVTLTAPKATSARLSDLTPGTRYSFGLWTYDARHEFSRRAVVRFTTLAASPGDATISGTVTDGSGNPLANVKVFIETFGGLEPDGTRTDAGGHYSLTVAPGGYYVGFDGALASGGVSDVTGYQSDIETVDGLSAAEVRTGVDAVLTPGAEIVGRVSDSVLHGLSGVVPSAEPVTPYVEVTTNSSFAFFEFFGPTDTNPSASNGTFAIKGLPPATVQVCLDPTISPVTGGRSDTAGYVGRCESRSVTLRVGRATDVGNTSLASNSGGVLSGVVTDPSGAPVAGAFVEARRSSNQLQTGGYGYTDNAGRYRVTVRRGSYRICAAPESDSPGSVSALPTCSAQVSVSPGDARTVDVQLRPGGSVAGQVFGPDGHPVADAFVDIRRAGHRFSDGGVGYTDAHGQFEAGGLAAGSYYACVHPDPFANPRYPTGVAPGCIGRQTPVSVRIGSVRLGLDGRLQIGGAISGQVTDDSGDPTADALVDVIGQHGNFDIEVGVSADGTFEVDGLPSGTYHVCPTWLPPFDNGEDGVVFGFGFIEPCRSPGVEVTAGQTTSGVTRRVRTGGSVTVSVRDAAGNPIGGVDVAALSACPDNGFCSTVPLFDAQNQVSVEDSQVTSANGIAKLHGLRPGPHAICLFGYYGSTTQGSPRTGYADSCAGQTFNVDVINHQTTVVDRQLDDAGAIAGTVTDVDGRPLAGVRLLVSDAATSDYFDPNEDFPFVPGGPAEDTVTDAHGHFVVRGVQQGQHTVCVDASHAAGGSSHTGYVDACVGGGNPRTATRVDVHVDEYAGANLSLVAGAAIAGKVTLATGHTRFIEVLAIRGRHGYITSVARDGHYRIARLPAGTYRVCFLAYRYDPECYDNVSWNLRRRLPRQATKIALTVGDERRGIDAVLRKAT